MTPSTPSSSISLSDLPVIIIGGYSSGPPTYTGLLAELRQRTTAPVVTVPVWPWLWYHLVTTLHPTMLMRLLDAVVRNTLDTSGASQVRIVGHSLGGLLARLYVSQSWAGSQRVAQIVALGSPHSVLAPLNPLTLQTHALITQIKRRCDDHWLTTHDFLAVAGRGIKGSLLGWPHERFAYHTYHAFLGDGNVWGDGLIPLQVALAVPGRHLVLDEATHSPLFGPWYGSPPLLDHWWHAALTPQLPALA